MSLLQTFTDLEGWSKKQIRKFFGGKALGLFEAAQLGIPIPPTWLLSSEHYDLFIRRHPKIKSNDFLEQATQFISSLLAPELDQLPDAPFAIRSSADAEDSSEHSFARIFDSKLQISKGNISSAIAEVWHSVFSLRASSYLKIPAILQMGVIIQPMVEAKFAGVLFSKHPSPSNVFENQNIIIEFAPTSGEKIVQGEITPFRLSGTVDTLSASTDAPWLIPLLQAMDALQQKIHHEIDIEFAIDQKENFWLLQQRPISKIKASHTLDLTDYTRKYKRSLFSLDIELLIDGCAQFLAPYLEVPYQFDRWMVMTTNAEGSQELWLHTLLNQAVTHLVSKKITESPDYLYRIQERYLNYHHTILTHDYTLFSDTDIPLPSRFFHFCEFIAPLTAHYYVPMFLIDALHSLLLSHMKKIDEKNADSDLFFLGTIGISTLHDLLKEELSKLAQSLRSIPVHYKNLKPPHKKKLEKLSLDYGFLKCHQIHEEGYTPEELFDMLSDLEHSPQENQTAEARKLQEKYFTSEPALLQFDHFRTWMKFRNQEMEYLMYAILQSRSLLNEICTTLKIDIKNLWNSSTQLIHSALKLRKKELITSFATDKLVIYRRSGKTHLSNTTKVLLPLPPSNNLLKGKTVFGEGQIKARVKIAYRPQDLAHLKLTKEPHVLVTGMTTPDFIPYLQKSFSALITDEGGILCHAAIVSREIQIPCIVGTSTATEHLKDGSKVLIDLDRAEITLL